MGDIRIKIAAAAVCIGLGGLGGFAMASNPAANQAPGSTRLLTRATRIRRSP